VKEVGRWTPRADQNFERSHLNGNGRVRGGFDAYFFQSTHFESEQKGWFPQWRKGSFAGGAAAEIYFECPAPHSTFSCRFNLSKRHNFKASLHSLFVPLKFSPVLVNVCNAVSFLNSPESGTIIFSSILVQNMFSYD
jgi:hypothetical protein